MKRITEQHGPQLDPKSIKHRRNIRLTDRSETCAPKIHQKSSLGAPKGRQSDFEYSTALSFWAGGVPWNN